MPKKKGIKHPRGTRQNRRERMLARKKSNALAAAAEQAISAEPKKAGRKPVVEKKKSEPKRLREAQKAMPVPERRKPGRKPKAEEQKAEAKQLRTAQKTADSGKATVYIQFKGLEDRVDDLIEAVRTDFRAAHKRTPITGIKLYVKPEEYTVYYVVNDSYFGKVNM